MKNRPLVPAEVESCLKGLKVKLRAAAVHTQVVSVYSQTSVLTNYTNDLPFLVNRLISLCFAYLAADTI